MIWRICGWANQRQGTGPGSSFDGAARRPLQRGESQELTHTVSPWCPSQRKLIESKKEKVYCPADSSFSFHLIWFSPSLLKYHTRLSPRFRPTTFFTFTPTPSAESQLECHSFPCPLTCTSAPQDCELSLFSLSCLIINKNVQRPLSVIFPFVQLQLICVTCAELA